MYKLLLADDESDIREGLMEVVDFEKYGFAVVGQAANGLEALQLCEKEKPDLIISDIRMPLMDGLTMLEKAREALPTARFIILSGYDDFEFARQAMALNCLSYLLKPISSAEFIDALADARKKLDEEMAQRRDLITLRRHFDDSLPLLRATLLGSLLNGGVSAQRAMEAAQRYNLPLRADAYMLALLRVEEKAGSSFSEKEPELTRLAAMDIARDLLGAAQAYVFHYQEWIAVLQWFQSGEADPVALMLPRLEEIRVSIDHYLGTGTRVGVSKPCYSLDGLKTCARQAISALEQCTFWEDQPLLCAADLEPGRADDLVVSDLLLRALDVALKKSALREANEALCALMEACQHGKPSLDAYRSYLMEIFVSLLHTARDMSVEMTSHSGEALARLISCPPPEEAREILWGMCRQCAAEIAENRVSSSRFIARSAEEYIQKNYADPKLTLDKLCGQLHVSPSYFSALFKRETQKTFLQRLTDVRMAHAMNLIAGTDKKTAQVAEAVGIADPSYFSYAFKRYYGVSPSQARRGKEAQP